MSPDTPDVNHQSRGGHDQRHALSGPYWELAALTAERMFETAHQGFNGSPPVTARTLHGFGPLAGEGVVEGASSG